MPWLIDHNRTHCHRSITPLSFGYNHSPSAPCIPNRNRISPISAFSCNYLTIATVKSEHYSQSPTYGKASNNVKFRFGHLGLSIRHLAAVCPNLQTLNLEIGKSDAMTCKKGHIYGLTKAVGMAVATCDSLRIVMVMFESQGWNVTQITQKHPLKWIYVGEGADWTMNRRVKIGGKEKEDLQKGLGYWYKDSSCDNEENMWWYGLDFKDVKSCDRVEAGECFIAA
ncbi:hypothetical protein K402DRAFT_113579 [Aulographum hederae CBS 113979]|uniref:Uncharacterized protein n=1 Tax=Aulographum hederae CBS 113979 TaxID=1176131 RepID=A0A6G1GWE8_9PEZI|nr:hypothetical protein K402DRAFT_113579 [Aulographum hederae CBS 113979]